MLSISLVLQILLSLLWFPSCCDGLVNPVQDFLSRIRPQGGGPADTGRVAKKPAADPDTVLKQLDLQSSTEPALLKAPIQQIPNLLSASIPVVLRLGSGVFAQNYKVNFVPKNPKKYTQTYVDFGDKQIQETGVYKPPAQPIILYEFESCPFCRKVREACSMLSLSVTFRPTPREGRNYRQEIKTKYGKQATFPYMKDPNTGATIFESDDIISYLFKLYGGFNQEVPRILRPGRINDWLVPLSAGLGVGLARLGAGGKYRPSNPPPEPVKLWAYEGSPFCKIVREVLSELEIPHTVIYAPRGSYNRQLLFEETGRFQVPYFEDPNTGVEMFESYAIIEYLEKLYSTPKPSIEYL